MTITPPATTRVLRSQTAKAAAVTSTTKTTQSKRRRYRADPWEPKRKPNPNPRPRPSPPTHYTCRICVEEQPTHDFVRWVPPVHGRWSATLDVPFDCIIHLARNPRKTKIDPICKTCISNSMSARLDTHGARQVYIGCLEPGCEVPWSHDFVMQYMPVGEALEKFNMEMLDVWKANAHPKLLACPSPTCTAMGLPDRDAPGYPQVACNECSSRSCAQCEVPWHTDITCAEHLARHIDEKLSDPEKDTLKLMQSKDARRCPNCGLVIEKSGGCDSMLCAGCQKYFNWTSAASAIAGARKPAPHLMHHMPYQQIPESGVCEMDGLLGKQSDATTASMVAARS